MASLLTCRVHVGRARPGSSSLACLCPERPFAPASHRHRLSKKSGGLGGARSTFFFQFNFCFPAVRSFQKADAELETEVEDVGSSSERKAGGGDEAGKADLK